MGRLRVWVEWVVRTQPGRVGVLAMWDGAGKIHRQNARGPRRWDESLIWESWRVLSCLHRWRVRDKVKGKCVSERSFVSRNLSSLGLT